MKPESHLLREAVIIRKFEEKLFTLFQEGLIHGTIHTCIGQELAGVAIATHLSASDAVCSGHRNHGHYLAFTKDGQGLMAEILGKEIGVCKGRGGSQHIHNGNFFTNGIQGNIVPFAAGLAMAYKIQRSNGSQNIAVIFLGDGTFGEGAVYETMNMAAVMRLPILFVVESNQYAQSTKTSATTAGHIVDRAAAFSIQSRSGNTWEYENLSGLARQLINQIRNDCTPALLSISTYRLSPHSKGDEYRSQEEIKKYINKDPISLFIESKYEENIKVCLEAEKAVDDWVRVAINSAPEKAAKISPPNESPPINWKPIEAEPSHRFVENLNQAFHRLMQENEEIFFFGQDVCDPYGGAFKVSKGLSEKFPSRVWNMPISEGSIVGFAAGLSAAKKIPIVEIMFGDFITLAADQVVNGISKYHEMYPAAHPLKLIVRTPMGGYRGYGPTHSQSLEKLFFGISGLNIFAQNGFIAPYEIYQQALEFESGPILFLENKVGYSKLFPLHISHGFIALQSDEAPPSLLIKPIAPSIDVTIITYGGMTELAISAAEILFEEHDIICQILSPVKIHPFQISKYRDILATTKLIVCLEEGTGFAGFASEVIAQISTSDLIWPNDFIRIHAESSTVPAARGLEAEVLPSIEKIVGAIAVKFEE